MDLFFFHVFISKTPVCSVYMYFRTFPHALCPRDKSCLKQLRVRTSKTNISYPHSAQGQRLISLPFYILHDTTASSFEVKSTSRFFRRKQNRIISSTSKLDRKKSLSSNIKNISAAHHNEILSDSKWKKENFTEIRSQMSLFIILNLTYLWGRNRMKFSVEFILNYLIWNG